MNEKNHGPLLTPVPGLAVNPAYAKPQMQPIKPIEGLGRHVNAGQKDHQGARIRRASLGESTTAADLGAPNGRSFIALLEAFRATGGTAPGEIVGRLLEEHQTGNAASLAKLIDTDQVFGFEWRTSLWIPMFQFHADDLALHAGAQYVRAELPPTWSDWAVAAWFATPNAHLEGRRPVDRLDSDLDAVLRAAASLDAVDEFVPYHLRRADGFGLHV